MQEFSVFHVSICMSTPKAALGPAQLLGLHGSRRERVCKQMSKCTNEHVLPTGSLLSFNYITSSLGESRLSFKLTNLFPNPLQACAGLPPIQSNLLLRFPRLDFTPFCCFWLSLLYYLGFRVLACHLVFTTCTYQKNFPCCFYSSLHNPS